MTALKTNIDHYMEMKNIKMYSHLLVDIAHQLGIKGQKAFDYAEREKSNFSKMLKGERPLKYEFIIPLEKIFGVSLARIMDEDAYKLPVEKENVAFVKGFRYYAAIDDYDLYEKEFALLLDKEGKSILSNTDEYGKTFLDYIVEYGSKNGALFFYKNFKPKLKWFNNNFELGYEKGYAYTQFTNAIPFARLVAGFGDPDMFFDIYDSYNMFFSNGHYGGDKSVFNNKDFLEIIMDDEKLFKNLFEVKEYVLKFGIFRKTKTKKDSEIYHSVNPILNNCLNHALHNLPKYRKQAIEILEFGIKHNEIITNGYDTSDFNIYNELGGISSFRDKDFLGFAIVVYDNDVKDEEINSLIDRLPKFKDYCGLLKRCNL